MSYNDFSLPQNWENLAKAYSSALKDKGFVFIRLDQNQNKKNQLASFCIFALTNLEKLYNQIQKKQPKNLAINKLEFLNKELISKLEKFYKAEQLKQESHKSNFNFIINIFKLETMLLKNLILLIDEEDNAEIRNFLKHNINSRLETLETVFN